ncbi:MAG: metal-dependent hydrolase [Candidatus Gracilibacteria bacterium]|nr:metal-dependent hydrolase [Candidatus Gracilibacteria bacterium]
MDSITQAVLGAAVGQVILGKKIGTRKAIVFGAIAGTIPDLDVLVSYDNMLDYVEYHRSLSHSILFAVLGGAGFAYAFQKFFDKDKKASFSNWYLMVFLGFFTHSLLDCFTTWGTQLFYPFSDIRIAFQSVFIIDLFYTIPLLFVLILAYKNHKNIEKATKYVTYGLIISTFYLFLGVGFKLYVGNVFENYLAKHNIEYSRYTTTTTPLNTFLWGLAAETKDGYYHGYYSVFDTGEKIKLTHLSKHHEYLDNIPVHQKEQIEKITKGYYAVQKDKENNIIVNDLRYTRLSGYEDIASDFTFKYIFELKNGKYALEPVKAGDMLKSNASYFVKRVFGYKE